MSYWKPEEVEILSKYWIQESDEQLSKRLSRSPKAIMRKRMRLGYHNQIKHILEKRVINC